MKNCKKCRYAEWKRTKTGSLHPSGDGRCEYPYKLPRLPASMNWVGWAAPKPCGGYINRQGELAVHCPYYGEALRRAGDPKPHKQRGKAAKQKLSGAIGDDLPLWCWK